MAVIVTLTRPGGLGSISAVGMGRARAMEVVSVPGTTTISLQEGEMAVLMSTETDVVLAAIGSTPDAQATTATGVTSAGFAIAPGIPYPVALQAGDKLNFKAAP